MTLGRFTRHVPRTADAAHFRAVERRVLAKAMRTAGRITVVALVIGTPAAMLSDPASVPGMPILATFETIVTLLVLMSLRGPHGHRRSPALVFWWAAAMLGSLFLTAFLSPFELRLTAFLMPMIPLLFALFMPLPMRQMAALAVLAGLASAGVVVLLWPVDRVDAMVAGSGIAIGPVLAVAGARLLEHRRAASYADFQEIRRLHRLAAERGRALELVNADLTQAARIDSLTGVGNRLRLREAFDRLTASDTQPTALAIADIDHFKRYNDSRGHVEGDAVLRRVADILRASVRDSDAVYRYGGEEFLVVLTGPSSEHVIAIAERVRSTLAAAHIEHPDSPVSDQITVSIGVAVHQPGVGSLQRTLREADAALYRAKRLGRDRVIADAGLTVLTA